MDVQAGEVCIPGDRLTGVEQCESGYGTYVRHGYIFSSLVGVIQTEQQNKDKLPIVSVLPKQKAQMVPEIQSVVTCKIMQLNPRFARTQILAVNNRAVSVPFRGMIRREDVRSTERDKVEIHKSFRPGDLVLAEVLSLGDASCYLLSTAKHELGVVVAKSENGHKMVPLSLKEMQCPVTNVKETRKVARVQKELLKLSIQQLPLLIHSLPDSVKFQL